MPSHRPSLVRPTLVTFAAALGVATLAGPAANARADEVPPISDLVPAHAMFVFEIDDFSKLVEAAEASSIKALLEHPKFVAFFEAIARDVDVDDQVDKDAILDRLGIDPKDLDWPTGRVGFASYFTDTAEVLFSTLLDTDSEFDPDDFHYLVIADLGPSVGPILDALDTIIDYGLDRDWLELDGDHGVGEHEIIVVKSLIHTERTTRMAELSAEYSKRIEALGPENWESRWHEVWQWYSGELESITSGTGDPAEDAIRDALAYFDTIAYTTFDDQLIAGMSPQTVEDALIAIADGMDSPASSAPFIVETASQFDPDSLARLYVNLNELMSLQQHKNQLFAQVSGYDSNTAAADDLWGINEIRGLGVGLLLDQPGAIAQIEAHLTMDSKQGLITLMDLHSNPFDPPAFVPADAIMAARFLVDFPSILDIARSYVQSLPDDLRGMFEAQLQMAVGMAGPILAKLGPEVYLWQTATESTDDPDSALSVFAGMGLAVRTGDPETLASSLAGLVSMAGLEGRTFEGAQLFASSESPVAVGLGEEWVFVGSEQSVEDALRRVSNRAGSTLADEPAFRTAMADLDADGPIAAYISLERILSAYEEEAKSIQEPWAEHFPPIDLWLQYLGDIGLEVISTDTGFSARIRIGEPQE